MKGKGSIFRETRIFPLRVHIYTTIRFNKINVYQCVIRSILKEMTCCFDFSENSEVYLSGREHHPHWKNRLRANLVNDHG